MELHAQEHTQLLRAMADHFPDGLYVVRHETIVFRNHRLHEIFQQDPDQGLDSLDRYHSFCQDPHITGMLWDCHCRLMDGGESQISWCQQVAVVKGADDLWIEVEAKRIEVYGQPAVYGTVRDVTQRKHVDQVMANSIRTLNQVLDALNDHIYIVTKDYEVVYGNKSMREGTIDDYRNYPCYMLIHGEDFPCEHCRNEETFASNKPVYWEFHNHNSNNWFWLTEFVVKVPGCQKPTKLLYCRNITQWRRAEERSRALSQRLFQVQETERKRISRELHDDLGQQLCAIKLSLGVIFEYMAKQRDTEHHGSRLNDCLQASLDAVRAMATDLRPVSLDNMGLGETIQTYCDNFFEGHTFDIDFASSGMELVHIDDVMSISLFRIVQEVLQNVVRHADATNVVIRLDASHAFISLVIEDNGKGFIVEDRLANQDTEGDHIGLIGIAERVELIGGSFKLDSAPGQGTKIVVKVYIHKAESRQY